MTAARNGDAVAVAGRIASPIMDTGFSPADEQRYLERGSRELLAKLRWAFLVGAVLFLAFTGLDYQLDPENIWRG